MQVRLHTVCKEGDVTGMRSQVLLLLLVLLLQTENNLLAMPSLKEHCHCHCHSQCHRLCRW